MSEYITTIQAAKLLNTTDRTIRRRLSAMSVNCPQLVQYVRKEGKTILIDKRLVLGNFEKLEPIKPEQPETIKELGAVATPEKIEQMLLHQLAEKDKQIDGLQKHISELTERNREQNIIIGRMQAEREQIRIEAAKETTPTEPPPPPMAAPPSNQNIILALLLIVLLGVLLIWLNTF